MVKHYIITSHILHVNIEEFLFYFLTVFIVDFSPTGTQLPTSYFKMQIIVTV